MQYWITAQSQILAKAAVLVAETGGCGPTVIVAMRRRCGEEWESEPTLQLLAELPWEVMKGARQVAVAVRRRPGEVQGPVPCRGCGGGEGGGEGADGGGLGDRKSVV